MHGQRLASAGVHDVPQSQAFAVDLDLDLVGHSLARRVGREVREDVFGDGGVLRDPAVQGFFGRFRHILGVVQRLGGLLV